jgi:succinate dehydrogenase/fumarate reductase-like Fe-S protein
MYMVPYICICKAVCDLTIYIYKTRHTLPYISKYRVPYTYKTSHTLSYINKYRVPYIYKTSHTLSYINKYRVPYTSKRQVTHCLSDLSYRCIWYPIFVYERQCVTCLIYIWYPIFVYVRQCVTCLIDVYGILYLLM